MRNRPENQIEIRLTLIRHGATLSNKEGRYLGKTDEALSPEGIGMLKKAVTGGNYPTADLLFSGPMKRCLETAQILYPGQTPIFVPEWTEMDFGAFEGHNYQELSGDPAYQRWIDSGGTPVSYTHLDVYKRQAWKWAGHRSCRQRPQGSNRWCA